ncbi:wall-associated receptor kinase 3-like [Phragmites australis]|uniref:wall-associated receptor kinase 3-like n=1 Tax=Phragmites australis TaxID=29695 RepID=UPI002D7670A8|nr:wall-associated receptor kinase 3-like [Phragmites australis]
MAVFAIATLQLLQILAAAPVLSDTLASSPQGCASQCGNVSIPYPFGSGAGCHRDGFKLLCNETYHPPKLFLDNTGVLVLEISAQDGTMRIDGGILSLLAGNQTDDTVNLEWTVPLNGSLYTVSAENIFAVLGCGFRLMWTVPDPNGGDGTATTCYSNCTLGPPAIATDGTCSGVGCCYSGLFGYSNTFDIQYSTTERSHTMSSSLVVVDREWWSEKENVMAMQQAISAHSSSLGASGGVRRAVPGIEVSTVVNWVFSTSSCAADRNSSDYGCLSDNSECHDSSDTSGYICMCQRGYHGNPYIRHGCQDINECASPGEYSCFGECINLVGSYKCSCPRGTWGDPRKPSGCASTKRKFPGFVVVISICGGIAVPLIIIGALFVRRKLRGWKARKSREFFFKQNRGLLLQRLVDKDIAERMIFTLEELDKATNKFDEARKLGGGGHGTVYKGILSDQRVVAIKKSKIVIKREIDDFINEVAILSQVNHRNVVKLFGCCLETEVPLLVYEFISNGTLSDHLHVPTPLSLSWKERVRIALETARSLAYLHSAATISIVHRDIKSTNILLDERLIAKVSDFGASRGIPIDQTGVNTAVQGTFGYLDPEYYHTWRLTEKSDVYSFGVILVELLTRKKPSVRMSSPGASLTAEFILLVNQDKISEILDPQVIEEGGEEAKEVAAMAVMCLSLHGEDRPMMRQVETRLEALQTGAPGVGNSVGTDGPMLILNNPSLEQNNTNARENLSRRCSIEEEFLCSMSLPR